MAINLTSVVTQFLTPEVIAQIASFLGIDRSAAQKAAGGAVPAILAGLSDLVATPAGTNQLSKLLSQQPGGGIADLMRSAGPEGLAQSGSSMLSGLFGGKTMDGMAQVMGRFAGIGDSGGKSLLGVVGPIVLGALGQQQRDAGLDTNGLASLLRSQKDQIVAALEGHRLPDAHLLLLRQSMEHLALLAEQIEELDRGITGKIRADGWLQAYENLQSIPGVKETAASEILAEVGPEKVIDVFVHGARKDRPRSAQEWMAMFGS